MASIHEGQSQSQFRGQSSLFTISAPASVAQLTHFQDESHELCFALGTCPFCSLSVRLDLYSIPVSCRLTALADQTQTPS